MRERMIVVLTMLLCSTGMYAQKNLLALVDSFLYKWYYDVNIDTNYVTRLPRGWIITPNNRFCQTELEIESRLDGKYCKIETNSALRLTQSVRVTYSGLSLTLALNPLRLSGRNTDWEFSVSSYGSRVGFEFTAIDSKTMKGTMNYEGVDFDLNAGDVSQKLFYVTGYYAFNSRRFSHSAVFSQSYIQKRSAGSWLLSAAFYASRIKTRDTSYIVEGLLDYYKFALGGGYGYNWVPTKNLLIHISGTPSLCLYSRNKLELDAEYEKPKDPFPEFIIMGKGAAVYHYKKWFFGLNTVVNFFVNGNSSSLQVLNSRWSSRVFVGYRF